MIKFQIDDEIVLSELVDEDAPAVFACVNANSEHLMEFMHWMRPNYSIVDAREYIAQSTVDAKQKKSLYLGIFRGEKFIGSVGFADFDRDAKATEIGYWIDRTEEGKGIVSRSCRLLINYAFSELKMNRIQIRCAAENVRSAAIPERFGFVKEGVLRQSQFRNGKLHDFLVYGLLAADWGDANQRQNL